MSEPDENPPWLFVFSFVMFLIAGATLIAAAIAVDHVAMLCAAPITP